MSHTAPIRALVLAVVLVMLSAAPAQAGTIVFDFEDGFQGWELFGSAQRVQTQLLGGEWAIFGDGDVANTYLAMTLDLGEISGIELDQLASVGSEAFIAVQTILADGLRLQVVSTLPGGVLHKSLNLEFFTGVRELRLTWSPVDRSLDCAPPPAECPPLPPLMSFIDNVTFHTIPEPNVFALLALGGVAALARRPARRRNSP